MRLLHLQVGPVSLSLAWGDDDDDQGPGDGISTAMDKPVGFAVWAEPDIPSLERP